MSKLVALLILGNIIITGIVIGLRRNEISTATAFKIGGYFFLSYVAIAYVLRLVPEWIEPRL